MASIYTNPDSINSIKGATLTLEVVISDGSNFTVSSSNTNVATVVNNNGVVVTFVDNGTANIIITSGSDNKNVPVTVSQDTTDYSKFADDVSEGSDVPLDKDVEQITDDTNLSLVKDDLEILSVLYPDPEPDSFIFGRNVEAGLPGINSKDLGIIVGQVVLPLAPTITENIQNVSGMYGQHWLGNNYGGKTFSIPIAIPAGDDEQLYRNTVENISNALISLNNEEIGITFGDWADRTYFGHFTSLPDLSFVNPGSWDAQGTLTFVASDPKGYLEQETTQVNSQPFYLTPDGNAESSPIIGFKFKGDVKQFGYALDNGNEGVMVGYSDDDIIDLKPVAFVDNMEDVSTFTKVTDMSKYKFDIPNGDVAGSGRVKPSASGAAIQNDVFYDSTWVGYDYNPKTPVIFGNLLLSQTFDTTVSSGVHNFELTTQGVHKKYYSRALQSLQYFLIGNDGKRYGRFGIFDRGTGWMPHVSLYIGKNTQEERVNLAKGIGYDGWGNTQLASDLRTWGVMSNNVKTIAIKSNNATFNNLSVDRQVTQTITSTSYYGYSGFHRNEQKIVYGTKHERNYVKVTTYATPRDAHGKATGPQRKQEKITKNQENNYKVALNKIVRKRVNGRTIKVSQNIELNSSQKIVTKTIIWGNTIGNTTTVITQNFDRGYKNSSYYWYRTSSNKYVHVDANTNKKTANVVSGVNYKVEDADEFSAFSNIFARFNLSVQDKKLTFRVSQSDLSNGHEIPNSDLLNISFELPYDLPLNRVGIFFGKQLIQEDKRTGATTNDVIKKYADDWLEVTHLKVNKLLDGYALNTPRIIAHEGDEATIDTETEDVYINGQLTNSLRSIRSTFPQLNGGAISQFNFIPSNAEADIKITYRPSMR